MKPQLANTTNNIVTSNERKQMQEDIQDNNEGAYQRI